MVALSPNEIFAQQFRDQFVYVDGQYYFTVSDIDWMLPVNEDVPWKKENLFQKIYGTMRVLIWALMIGMGFYLILLQNWSYFLILVPVFIVGTFAHIIAFALPNLDLWNRLRALNAQSDAIKSQFLVPKPARK